MKNFLIAFWYAIRSPLLTFLKNQLIKQLVARLVKSAFLADFRIWLIEMAVEYLIDEIARPVVNLFFRKVGYAYEVQDGKHLLKKIQNSSDLNDWEHNANSV